MVILKFHIKTSHFCHCFWSRILHFLYKDIPGWAFRFHSGNRIYYDGRLAVVHARKPKNKAFFSARLHNTGTSFSLLLSLPPRNFIPEGLRSRTRPAIKKVQDALGILIKSTTDPTISDWMAVNAHCAISGGGNTKYGNLTPRTRDLPTQSCKFTHTNANMYGFRGEYQQTQTAPPRNCWYASLVTYEDHLNH